MNNILLTNQEVEYLYSWLNIPLHGELLRARNKFIRMIGDQHEATQERRVELLKELTDKDPATGEPIIENGVYKVNKENMEIFSKKFTDVLENGNKEYDISYDTLKGIVDILMNRMTKGLDINEGAIYDSILEELSS